jgi:TyrR family helix-turn-helix protein
MGHILEVASKLGRQNTSGILITGESGTGKGLVAKYIHDVSRRKNKPFIQINCATLPLSLFEAEFFGYEDGAFTGAKAGGKPGLVELAHNGTLFLDEIGEFPLHSQAKLLKYLDDRHALRLGGTKAKFIDCCIIAATNRDIDSLVEAGKIRKDLYYRINTFTINIPPLRERPEDIFELTKHYLSKFNRKYDTQKRMKLSTFDFLKKCSFPGNVRQLESVLKQAIVMSEKEFIDEELLKSLRKNVECSTISKRERAERVNLQEEISKLERKMFLRAKRKYTSTREIASYLGISQPTVVRKLRKYGLATEIR